MMPFYWLAAGLAYFGPPDRYAQADEIHVDRTFTWDKPAAEWLAKQWRAVAPTKLGGVAYGDPGHEFIPGRYIKLGYGFTSRGCPRRCWFCSAWKRNPGTCPPRWRAGSAPLSRRARRALCVQERGVSPCKMFA
jgi:hypothetical protein